MQIRGTRNKYFLAQEKTINCGETMKEYVILVDEKDNETGLEEKMKAHEGGKLHRAFSIFIFNPEGKMLLQKRAESKYHCGGLWTNACCSHPRKGETVMEAAHRRLKEEMGFDCELKEAFSFVYKAKFGNGLTEHEYDHVFTGVYGGPEPIPDKNEVDDFKWIGMIELEKDVSANPDKYTPWFKIALKRLLKSKEI